MRSKIVAFLSLPSLLLVAACSGEDPSSPNDASVDGRAQADSGRDAANDATTADSGDAAHVDDRSDGTVGVDASDGATAPDGADANLADVASIDTGLDASADDADVATLVDASADVVSAGDSGPLDSGPPDSGSVGIVLPASGVCTP